MTDTPESSDAPVHVSAASEERFIASTEEFAAESSRATVLATNILQALLVGCVVLWVLDIPRQLLGVSFYTEQLLAVTLGLTLALAFITESVRKPGAIDWGGVYAVAAIVAYLIYHYYAQHEIAWLMVVVRRLPLAPTSNPDESVSPCRTVTSLKGICRRSASSC